MRKNYVSLAVLGLGGVGLLLLSDRGHEVVRWITANVQGGPARLLAWNDVAQREFDRIQIALNRVAETIRSS
jgi:hypothetical protein